MYLAAAEAREESRSDLIETPLPSAGWQDFPFSRLSHHGGQCCDVAREWVLAMDFAQLNGNDLLSGPRWLRQKYEWGPSAWPIHWCDAVGRQSVDCGIHAALAHEAFVARGVVAYRAQFVQRYSREATAEWRGKWGAESASDHWIGEDLIYHEGNALVVRDDEVKLWDGSAGWWINPRLASGYGALLAVRIWTEGAAGAPRAFRWGEHSLDADQWNDL